MSLRNVRWLLLAGLGTLLGLGTGCSAECVDEFDCKNDKGPPPEGKVWECRGEKCVAEDEGGEEPDPDGGMEDGGTEEPDGGTDGGADAGPGTSFSAGLSGAQEVPAVRTAATGTATCTLTGSSLACQVTHDVAGANGAHIHQGAPGESGPVLHGFNSAASPISQTFTLTAGQVALLRQGLLYVNVHSPAHEGGEVRGQLLRPGEKAFVANLTGAQEVPAVNTTGTGSGSVIVNGDGSGFSYRIATSITAVQGAHVHLAPGGVTGPVLVPLTVPTDGGVISGMAGLDAGTLAALERGLWYLNVHTTAHPAGEIRGQLLAPGERLHTAILTGNAMNPDAGVGLILNYAQDQVRYDGVIVSTTSLNAPSVYVGTPSTANPPLAFPLSSSGPIVSGVQAVEAGTADQLTDGGLFIRAESAQGNRALSGQLLPR